MKHNSFIQIARFPLLGLLVLYPLVLLLYFWLIEIADFSSLLGAVSIFLIPIISSIFLSWREAKSELDLFDSLKIQTIFVLIETLIFFGVASSFRYDINFNTLSVIFAVLIIFHYFLSGLVKYFHTEEKIIKHDINKHNEFEVNSYLNSLGTLNIISFSFLTLFLGLVFDAIKESLFFLFFLALFMLSLEFIHKMKNSLGGVILLIIAIILSIYFYSIFSLVILSSCGLVLITLWSQGNTKQTTIHLLNWIYFVIHLLSVIGILFLVFVLLDTSYNLSNILNPIIILILFTLTFIIATIIAYFLMLSSAPKTLKEYKQKDITWPISRYIKSSNDLIKDSLIYGSLMGLSILIIIYGIMLLGRVI